MGKPELYAAEKQEETQEALGRQSASPTSSIPSSASEGFSSPEAKISLAWQAMGQVGSRVESKSRVVL